jgi:hypothetical protein
MRVMAQWSRRVSLVACGVLLFSTSLSASWQDQAAVEPFALGLSTTASTKFESIGLNPAIAAVQKNVQIGTSTSQVYGDTASVVVFNAVSQLPYNTVLALRSPIKTISGLPETQASSSNEAEQTGTFSDTEAEVELTLARQITTRPLYLGVSLASLHHKIQSESATGYRLDAGLLYITPYANFAASIEQLAYKKLWSTGRNEAKPKQTHFGIMVPIKETFKLFSDVTLQKKERTQFHLGLESRIGQHLNIQMGLYDTFQQQRFSVGTALQLSDITLTYALSQHDTLGSTHKMGVQLAL